jgi:hypothetical protein
MAAAATNLWHDSGTKLPLRAKRMPPQTTKEMIFAVVVFVALSRNLAQAWAKSVKIRHTAAINGKIGKNSRFPFSTFSSLVSHHGKNCITTHLKY